MSRHTPTPWMNSESGVWATEGGMPRIFRSENGAEIYRQLDRAEQKANEEYVVKCANIHEKLVEALRSLVGNGFTVEALKEARNILNEYDQT